MIRTRWFGGEGPGRRPALSPVPLFRRGRRLLAVAVVGIAVAACEGGDGESAVEATSREGSSPATVFDAAPFPGSEASLEALGRTALEAVTRGDTATLERLRLTEHEHNEVVWPELPASAPELNFPVDYAWKNIRLRNRAALDRVLPQYRDWAVTYEGIHCEGRTEEFETFRVHTDCTLLLSTEEGVPLSLQLFEDALERGGGFKLFRYYDHSPRRLDAGPT